MTTTERMHLGACEDTNQESAKVERLRKQLGEKSKQEKDFRFYSLYGHILNMNVLKVAWKLVRKNKGAPGIDGVTIESLDAEESAQTFLIEIQHDLQSKTYRPKPVRRVYIPKADGKLRPLGIPVVKDRVIQAAVCLILEPIFEADFKDSSYGFRPGRSQHQALQAIQKAIAQGMTEVYDADLKAYFDTIPHDKLMNCLKKRISDRNILHLILMWLRAPVHESKGSGKPPKVDRPQAGTPQGGVISPLLANVYLHWFDVAYQATETAKAGGATLVRFADDFVILTKKCAKAAAEFAERILEGRAGLTINREKTKIVNLEAGEELFFLGFSFRYQKDLRGRKHKYLHWGPSVKSFAKAKERLRGLTSSARCSVPIPEMIEDINEYLRGWSNYFRLGYPRRVFRRMNYYVLDRLTGHLNRRSQRRYNPPKGVSYYQHLQDLGLVYL